MTEEVQEQEPIIIETKGKWVKFEEIANTSFEVGKVYNINVGGNCQFMISKHKPTYGLITDKITYTKDNENFLWIKTR